MTSANCQLDDTVDEMPIEAALCELLAETPADCSASSLLRTSRLEVTQLEIRAGEQHEVHAAAGDVVIVCLQGRTVVQLRDTCEELTPGKLFYLPPGVPHALAGIEDSLLVMINTASGDSRVQTLPATALDPPKKRMDVVHEASLESFPASDPPAWGPVTSS